MDLVTYMKNESKRKIRGIYWLFQIEMAFNSNKLEGSQLTQNQTQYLFDEEKIYSENGEDIPLNDIQETMNHFRAFDYILENVNQPLNICMIKHLHFLLKRNTSDEDNPLTPVGQFKTRPNVIGSFEQVPTTPPKHVEKELSELLSNYLRIGKMRLDDIVDFHVKFQQI